MFQKAGQGLWRRWGGKGSKVSTPPAREAVTTRSAEVQVSERDNWLTRPSGTSPPYCPSWTFHPSFSHSPCLSSVTHPSLPSTTALFTLFTPCLPSETKPCHLVILPSFLSPHSPLFSPLKLNSTTGFHSTGQADWGSSLRGWMSSVQHHVLTWLTFTLSQKHIHAHTEHIYMHTGVCHKAYSALPVVQGHFDYLSWNWESSFYKVGLIFLIGRIMSVMKTLFTKFSAEILHMSTQLVRPQH